MSKTVYILGAGFSKSANAPLQSELIKEIFRIKNDELPHDQRNLFLKYRNEFKNFLSDAFFTDETKFEDINLEDIYTPIDRCISDNLAFRNISPMDLIEFRQKINGLIIIMLDHKLRMTRTRGGHIEHFTNYLITQRKLNLNDDPFAIISTNWDILIDNALKRKIPDSEGTVDYCCNVTPYDSEAPVMTGLLAKGRGMYNIKILKLHGSMNWLHCKRCQRLFVTFFEKIALNEYVNKPICRMCEKNFKNSLTSDGGAMLSSQLIMPTFLKDLNNVQLKMIWQNAGIELSEASKIIFMGYSLPMADFELRQLLARNVRHHSSIEVVLNKRPDNSNIDQSPEKRYRAFFGKRPLVFHYGGVKDYIDNLNQ